MECLSGREMQRRQLEISFLEYFALFTLYLSSKQMLLNARVFYVLRTFYSLPCIPIDVLNILYLNIVKQVAKLILSNHGKGDAIICGRLFTET